MNISWKTSISVKTVGPASIGPSGLEKALNFPPGYPFLSTTVTFNPCWESKRAETSPPIPAPTMIICSFSFSIKGILLTYFKKCPKLFTQISNDV